MAKNNKRSAPKKKTEPTFHKAGAEGESINISKEEMDRRNAEKAKADKEAQAIADEAAVEAKESQDALENAEAGESTPANPDQAGAEGEDKNTSDPAQNAPEAPKATEPKRTGNFDRLARPTGKGAKFGLVYVSRAGSYVYGGTRFTKDTCNSQKPYMPKNEKEMLELHATGHFKKVAV